MNLAQLLGPSMGGAIYQCGGGRAGQAVARGRVDAARAASAAPLRAWGEAVGMRLRAVGCMGGTHLCMCTTYSFRHGMACTHMHV